MWGDLHGLIELLVGIVQGNYTLVFTEDGIESAECHREGYCYFNFHEGII
jgi:hypothetical protein